MARDIFDASGSGGREEDRERQIQELLIRSAEADLVASFDRIDDLTARHEEQVAEEEFDPGIAAALQAITGREDAPLAYRSLRRRVDAGLLTWKQFWIHPDAETDGMRLVNDALRFQTQSVLERLRSLDDPDRGDETAR